MTYRIAGIDVHKKMLAVAVADAADEEELRFQRRKFPAGADGLRAQLTTEPAVGRIGRSSK